ncbi:hypothetical protein SBDP2_300018 [Syntrophobacter sp. SbD2]|nr:hypothetical protein SBDP2_300018 [Syntrophobacter sp. SbD2]
MLKTGEKIPSRRRGAAAEKKAGRREARSQETQVSGGTTEAQDARTGREGPAIAVTPSIIVATISSRTGHDSSAYEKSTLIRHILRRMKVTRLQRRRQ